MNDKEINRVITHMMNILISCSGLMRISLKHDELNIYNLLGALYV